ncbi:MAG: YegS/Rv2252/BmrU family lipid kinase [Chloroflexi bacterium]|nr:YegS/Rv2252/BmrU family lipid kinase [Chloroflexota bacterium]
MTGPTPALDLDLAGDPDDPPPPERRYLVIRNVSAGWKGGISTNSCSYDELCGLLQRRGLTAEVVETADEDAARAAVRAAVAGDVDVVVAAGGDGTVGLVAGELLDTGTALGVLPLGSVMNIARMLGLPRDLEGAADILAAGPIATVDVGVADDRVFYEAGSVGMNAAIFREAARFDDGDWLSIVRTIWVALRYRPARMRLRLDDREIRTRALMVTVSNGPYTGAGMTVAPDARLDDGKFDIRVFRGFSKFELIRHLGSIAFGRRRYTPHVSTYRSRRVGVTSAHPLPARADAHDLGTTPVTFETRPSALRVVVPPGHS